MGRSAFHILAGAAEMVDEGVFIVADFGLALFETTGRIFGYDVRFNSYSNVMQALDSGGLSLKEYYTSFLFDMATLGLYGKAQICYDYYRGNMTSDEFSRQLGGQSLLELSAMRGPKASRSVSGPNGTVTVNIGSSAITMKGEIPSLSPRPTRPWHLDDPYVVRHAAEDPKHKPSHKKQIPPDAFDNLEDAVGEYHGEVTVIDVVDVKNPTYLQQGYTKIIYCENSFGEQRTVAYNPDMECFKPGHTSSSNDDFYFF